MIWLRRLVIAILVILAAVWGWSAPMIEKGRRPDRYLIPAGYIGEVKVYYQVASAPPLPIEDGHYLLIIPANGILRTSSDVEYGSATDDDYYSYTVDGKRSQLSDKWWDDNAMIWGGGIGGDNFGNTYATFFVGTKDQFDQPFKKTTSRKAAVNVLS